jgi:phage tail-like protein
VYKRNIDIVQMDRDGSVIKRWTVFGAWPTKFKPGEWGGSQNEVVVETLTLEYDFFDKTL